MILNSVSQHKIVQSFLLSHIRFESINNHHLIARSLTIQVHLMDCISLFFLFNLIFITSFFSDEIEIKWFFSFALDLLRYLECDVDSDENEDKNLAKVKLGEASL